MVSQQQSYEPRAAPEPPEFELRDYEPIHPQSRWREVARKLWAPIAALGFLFWKFKALALVVFKFKVFTTSASMLVSIAAYSWIFGWKFAVGFVLLLLVHEMGHVLELRRQGVPASAPLFIPFLGAVVGMKQLPKDAAAEARVGLAGPILGSIGTLIPLAIWLATGEPFWQALAYVGFFLNLLNLLPVLPLDGGRAMAALTPWMWLVGFGLLVFIAIAYPSPIFLLVLLFGGFETYRRWKARKDPESQRYHEVTPRNRLLVAVVYIGLAVALGVAMDATFLERDFDDV